MRLQITTAFVLRAYKVAVVPTVIYAVALWGIGLGGGYLLGFNVGGSVPAWLQGARGFWVANTAEPGRRGRRAVSLLAACQYAAYSARSTPRRG